MQTLSHDFRHGFRMLRKSPGFTAVAVLTLALGIGANTVIFSAMNRLFFHPAGISDPGRLLAIRVKYDKLNLASIPVSLPDFTDVYDNKQVFSSAAAMKEADFNYAGRDLPERLLGAQVTSQWFETFGAPPMLGRLFHPEEDQPKANQVAVLSYSTWKRLFAGDIEIAGKTIQLNNQAYKVVGVMGPNFNWPNQAQLWVPLGLPPSEYVPDNRFNEAYFVVARVAPGVSLAQAESSITLSSKRLAQPQAQAYAKDSGWGMFALPLMEFTYGDLRTPMLILLGAVGLVLLIACANIAGLMLARASGRSRELAVRLALGASRWHLIRQTLAESLLIALAGSSLGLLLAKSAARALILLAPGEAIRNLTASLDVYVLLFTALAGILSAVLFGMAPAWQISGTNDFENLKEGGRSTSAGRARQRLRSVLVVAELSLALVLLVGAGLLLKSLVRLQQVSPGFESRGVMTATASLSPTAYAEDAKQIAFYVAVTQRLSSQPGIVSAAAAYPVPFSGQGSSSFEIEARPAGPGDPGPHSDLGWITPAFFSTMQIPLRAGRFFTDQDRATTQPVVVIDENLARQYWPNQDPIGQHVRSGTNSPWATVIGVVAHVKRSVLAGDTGKGVLYYSLLQNPVPGACLIARTSTDPSSLATTIREAVKSVDPVQAAAYDPTPMDQLLATSLGPRRFAVTLLGIFAAVALLMAALGLYGIISYSVSQRTQEIGIRMALGAPGSQVLRLIVGQGMRLVGAGALIGIVASFALTQVLSSELFQVSAVDPLTLLLTVLLMAAVALFASYLPARRATKVDPVLALRYE